MTFKFGRPRPTNPYATLLYAALERKGYRTLREFCDREKLSIEVLSGAVAGRKRMSSNTRRRLHHHFGGTAEWKDIERARMRYEGLRYGNVTLSLNPALLSDAELDVLTAVLDRAAAD